MKHKAILGVGGLIIFVLGGLAIGFALQKEVVVTFNDGEDDLTTKTWRGTLEEALAGAGLDVEALQRDYELSIPWDQPITEDIHVHMTRIFAVTLIDGCEETTVETKAFTVADFFAEQNLIVGELDEVNVPLTSPIEDNMKIIVDRIKKKIKTEKDEIPFETVKKEDANLEEGKEILAREGKPGEKITEITYVYKNGELIEKDKKVVEETDPVDKVIKIGTKPKPKIQKTKKKDSGVKLASRKKASAKKSPSSKKSSSSKKGTPSGNVWDQLASCESGGNWSANTGNGYYGGLQFSLESWRSVGGSGYPHEHSREEQIARGKILQARQGWSAWGTCANKLGLD